MAAGNGGPDRRWRRRPRILVGITGSIAAVKGPRLALRLAREVGADVKIVLSRTVERHFWGEGGVVARYDGEAWKDLAKALEASKLESGASSGADGGTASREGLISIHLAEEEWENYSALSDPVLHIQLRDWADLVLVAPLSAHTIGKIANGLCDDLLSCVLRAWDFGQRQDKTVGKPVVLAPAMNTAMWDHPITASQLDVIRCFARSRGTDGLSANSGDHVVVVIKPAVKKLACGDVGAGALAELDDIVGEVQSCLAHFDVNGRTSPTKRDKAPNGFGSASARKASMKRALLGFAKRQFEEMKVAHDGRGNDATPGSLSSSSQLAAPISPTPDLLIDTLLPHLHLSPSSFLIDLGCGDGRWLLAAAERTGCRCLGIDVDEGRLNLAENAVAERGLGDRVRIRSQDVFEFARNGREFEEADAIILYLFREAMATMGTLLHRRLVVNGERDESSTMRTVKILSVGFALPGWTSIHEEKVNGIRVYLYLTA